MKICLTVRVRKSYSAPFVDQGLGLQAKAKD